MKKIRRLLTVIFTLLVCFSFVPAAFAHPLGNFTINQYAGLKIGHNLLVIDYVVDMAEIPAFQELSTFDTNGNGQVDASEAAGYHAARCAALQPDLSLLLDQKVVTVTLASSSVEFPVGVGGLPTLRLTCEFQAPLEFATEHLQLSFSNNAFPARLGWTEVVVIPEGVAVQGDFSSTSLSHRLTNYPQDLLTSPLSQRVIELDITPPGIPIQNRSTETDGKNIPSISDRNDAFTRLILLDERTLSTVLLAIGIALVWGAMHAMTPGHGKTIVGAYLVGSRGTLRHALYLGLTTTITHTLGVFALGLITLFAAQYIVPETLYPWMSLLSGLLVVGIGINLLMSRFKSSGLKFLVPKASVARAPSSLVFQPTHVDRMGHQHQFVLKSSREHTHTYAHDHEHTHSHGHGHSDIGHSHLPPGADGSPITWRSLLALGVSGGLIPCPSALIVMLGAIALNRIGFGLILVLAFSLGLAGALTAIGMLFIYAGRLFQRFPSHLRIVRLLPILSALFVSVIGAAIIWKALGEMGIV